jgi:tetratricopeptide (TPR) repeat protein
LLLHRKFQPWEGGEGLVLAQYVRARLLLGQQALAKGDAEAAIVQFQAALQIPQNLSEARHPLTNQSDIYYWLGVAYENRGEVNEAVRSWKRAARNKGDFQRMTVRTVSDMTYWSALAHQRLGETDEAVALLYQIRDYSAELELSVPKIDYFATSLPTMLLFDEDLGRRNRMEAQYLQAQAMAGLGNSAESEQMLQSVLATDGNHMGAADLLQQIRMTQSADIRTH